jgi:hypothetical protein
MYAKRVPAFFKQNSPGAIEIEPKQRIGNGQKFLICTLLVRLHQIRIFSTGCPLLCKEFSVRELRIGALFLRSFE